MGIGAGWYEHEYDGYGYDFDKPSVRIGRLRESVEIMQAMWTEDEVSYHGEHYQLDGAVCQPKPVQEPRVPLWIAGGGEQLTLNVAARHADYTNFANGDVEQFNHKSEVLRGHCDDVGRDFDEIVRSTNVNVVCEETESDVQERLAWIKSHYTPFVGEERAERLVERNYVSQNMAGTPDQLVEELRKREEAGVGYTIVYFNEAGYDTSGLERFAREVVPEFS